MKIISSTNFVPKIRTQNNKQQLNTTNKITFEGAPKKVGLLKILALAILTSIPTSLGHLIPNAEKATTKNNHLNLLVKNSIDTIKTKTFDASETLANLNKTNTTKAKKAIKQKPKTEPIIFEKGDSLTTNNSKTAEETKLVKNDTIVNNIVKKDTTGFSEDDNNFKIFFSKPSRQKSLERFEEILTSYYDKEHKVIGSNRKSRVYFEDDLALVTSYRLIEMAKENFKNTGKIINPKQLSNRKTDLYNTIADYVADEKIECNDFNTKMLIRKLLETKNLKKREIPFVKIAFAEVKTNKH